MPRFRMIGDGWRRVADSAARLAFAASCRAAMRLPTAALLPLGRLAAIVQIVLCPGRAWAYQSNLKSMPAESRAGLRRRLALTFNALTSFGLFILEFFKISRMDRDGLLACFTFSGLEELDRALAKGNGVVLVTAHIGNWEAGALALAYRRYGLHVVAGVQFSSRLSPHVKALKERSGVQVVSPGPGDYRRLVEALSANRAVALVVDGDTFEKGLEVPFFRRTLRAPAGPARLAALTGASVISTHVIRSAPMRFSMGFRTLWEGPAPGLPLPDDPGLVLDLTTAVMKDQESAIGRHLDQWCVFRPLWPGPRKRTSDERA